MSRLNPLSGVETYADELRESFKSLNGLLVIIARALTDDTPRMVELEAVVDELVGKGHL